MILNSSGCWVSCWKANLGICLSSVWQYHVAIHNVFVLRKTKIGLDSMIGGGRLYHCIVELHLDYPKQVYELLVREIIEQQKPAFLTYELDIINSQSSGEI